MGEREKLQSNIVDVRLWLVSDTQVIERKTLTFGITSASILRGSNPKDLGVAFDEISP
jgi:hypothetical protein